jgi:tRNA(Ser,Leu) C12 N-acetylase TAN1
MGLLIVTAPCGKEEAAKLEVLDCIFHADSEASFIPHGYMGLLLLKTRLSSDEAAALVRDCPTAYVHRIVPVDLMIESDLTSIIEAVLRLMPKKPSKVRIECQRRGRFIRSSQEVESAVGSALKSLGHEVQMRSPQTVVRIDIIGEWTTISVGPPERFAKKLRG